MPDQMDSERSFSQLKYKECILNNPNSKFYNLITLKEIETLVKKTISTDAKLVDYDFRSYSKEKLGFLGSHFSLVIEAQKPVKNAKEMRKFFVKTMPLDVPSQLTFMQEKGYFDKEIEFFRSIEPLLLENFKGDTWGPKCYLAKENVLIFEDLSTKGYANRSKLLSEQSAKAALASIARLQAACLLAEERNNGRSLIDIFPKALEEFEFDRTDERGYKLYTVAMDLAVAIANNLDLDSSRIRQAGEHVFDIGKISKTKHNTISHGDLWSSNLMFNSHDHCRVIDFQLIRYSPLSQDVMLLLYLSTSRKLRQQHTRNLIEYYHQVLIKTLIDNSFKGRVPTLDEILQGAEEQKLSTLVVAVMYNAAQMMDGKAATVLDDSQNYENYYFKDRKPFVFKHMAENEEYKKKLEDNVRELVEVSMIIDSLPPVS